MNFRWRKSKDHTLEDLDQAIQEHIETETRDNIEQGMSPEEARYTALRKFGNVTRIKEQTREAWGFVWLERLLQDIRFGVRMLRKSPGFAAVVVLTLALGIGANTAIFSVVQGVVLAPLPYHQPDQLVIVWAKNPLGRNISPSYADVQDWQRETHSFQSITALTFHPHDLTNPGSPEHLDGWPISAGFFRTLGVNPILGRDFSPEEDEQGGARVVIISERIWRNRFAASPSVLGKTVTMDGADYTIVGVVRSGISLGGIIDVYTPMEQFDPLIVNDRRTHAFVAIGRLKPGVSIVQAQEDVSAVEKHLGQLYPKFDQGLSASVVPLKEALVGDTRGTLLLLFGAVGLVLLIACANVSSLLLARSTSRTREFAVRSALGASRARIVHQLLTESVLLSLAGGGLGLALAKSAMAPILAAVPGDFPRAERVGLNPAVLLFTLATSITVGIVFGLIPALKTWNEKQQRSLKNAGRGATNSHHRTQSSLIVLQTALTLVLLVGTGLLFRTIRHLWSVNPGFDTHQLITFKVALSAELAKTPQAMRSADRQLIERIHGISGVQAADLTTLVPLGGGDNEVPFWSGPEPNSIAEAPRAVSYSVGPDYFQVMGIPLIRGRVFTAADTVPSEQVLIIDNALAEAYFPGQDPVGQSINFGRVGSFRIVGVVGHVKHFGLGNTNAHTQMQIYTPFYEIPDEWMPVMQPDTTILVRTQLEAAALVPAISRAVYGAGNKQPIYAIKTMREAISTSMSSQSFPMVLLGAFAGLALLLAAVGIYGLLANFVQQRTQEIGIRMALGAQRRSVFQMMIGQGLKLILVGIAIGIAGALIFTRVLSSFSHLLYGVQANDPLTFVSVALVLAVVAILACYLPARRAAKVDPMIALRYE